MITKQRVEMNWLGKGKLCFPEPRILIEKQKFGSESIKIRNGLLVKGDNLIVLRSIESRYAGKVKCIYIDPPYNTKSCFEHYDDSFEHSLWLNMMHERLVLMHRLLAEDGSIWISIDDGECHYLKLLCDEVFGRKNFVSNVIWRSSDASNNDAKTFSVDHNHILVYGKTRWAPYALPRSEKDNSHYKNSDNDPRGPWFAGNLSSPKPRPNLKYKIKSPTGILINPPANGWRWKEETLMEMIHRKEVIFSSNGARLIKKTYLANQTGLSPSTMWDDIEETGHNRQSKYELKKLFPEIQTSDLFATPKPERLIQRILELATQPGDLVLDCFAGSGTTGAVAQKMGRPWIMVERGDHCNTHIVPRLQQVINGTDQGGVSQSVGWKGGGTFSFCELSPPCLGQSMTMLKKPKEKE